MNDPGRTLGGRYQLGRVIGRGGMAVVSQARDLRLGRDVAVKELKLDLAQDPTFQARFRREAQAAAGLNHPNIVSVYDTGEESGPGGISVPYIVMELVEGRTLRDVLRDGRPILPRRALEFTQGVLDALGFSHRAGIVHRDIKPANVMLTPSGMVKVMDFGIARAVSDTSATMTQTAAVIGTAQYLSPEQARGETVDARSDLYSAGCLLYELLVGRPPFTGDSPVSVAYQHVREAPVPPSQLDPDITAPMDAVVLKALAKSPEDRYQSAQEMHDDISRILGGQRVSATLPPPVPPLVAPSPATTMLAAETTASSLGGSAITATLQHEQAVRRRRAGMWWALGIAALLVIGLVSGLVLLNRPTEPQVLTVVVPANLYGQPQTVAEAAVTAARLVPVVDTVVGADDGTVGRVIDVDPVPGTEVPEGSTVTLTVNSGPAKGIIPSGLKGRTVTEAQRILSEAGFTNVRAVEATDEPADATVNTVLSVTPGEGTQAATAEAVTLTFATGRARVPYLIGMTRAAATAEAQKYGFTALRFEEQESDDTPGTVIATRPLATTLVAKAEDLVIILAVERTEEPTTEPTTTSEPTSPGGRPTSPDPTSTP